MSSYSIRECLFHIVLLLTVLLLSRLPLYAQAIPVSQGKEFFVAFMPNVHDTTFSRDSLRLYFTGGVDVSVTIRVRSTQGSAATHTIKLNTQGFASFSLPWKEYEIQGMSISDGVMKNGDNGKISQAYIHVTSTLPITLTALNQADLTSDAALIYPIEAIGNQYTILAYNSDGYPNPVDNTLLEDISTPSEAVILATEDNTRVDIDAPVSLVGQASRRFSVILQKGESCLLQAFMSTSNLSPDITNTTVRATKPIAVFAGHQRSPVNKDLPYSRDHLFEQIPPYEHWGNEYFVAPMQVPNISVEDADIVRIISRYDNTEIIINGALTNVLSRGGIYEVRAVGPMRIIASAPILVGYLKGTAKTRSTNSDGDPAFMIIPPIEQYQKEYLVNNPRFIGTKINPEAKVYLRNFISVIIAERARPTLRLNGRAVTGVTWAPFVSSTLGKSCLEYVYAHIPVNDGNNHLIASESFGTIVSGYGYLDSYLFWGGIQPVPDILPPLPPIEAKGDTTICFGQTALLTVRGGNGTYKWKPTNGLDCPTCASVKAKPSKTTRYIVESVNIFNCPIFDTIWVNMTYFQGGMVSNDTSVCFGSKAQLNAWGGHHYEWYGDPSLSCTLCPNPTISPRKKTTCYVKIYNADGCVRIDSVVVNVTRLQAGAGPDRSICPGSNVELKAFGGDIYTWRKDPTLSCLDCPNPIASPLKKTTYYVKIATISGCYRDDTVVVDTKDLVTELGNDTTVCAGMAVRLEPVGGKRFEWKPDPTLSCWDCANPLATPTKKTTYYVTAYDQTCVAKDSITIDTKGVAADAGADTTICKGSSIALTASKGIRYEWRKHPSLVCNDCRTTVVKPETTTTYFVKIFQTPECFAEDSVTVKVTEFDVKASDDVIMCRNDSVQLNASGTKSFFWYPAEGLSCTQCPNPIAKPFKTTTYYVQGSESAKCVSLDSVTVTVTSMSPSVSESITLCEGQMTIIRAFGGTKYRWYGASTLSCDSCEAPQVMPKQTTTYYVEISDTYCKSTDSVTVYVQSHEVLVNGDTSICAGQQATLQASASTHYDWFPKDGTLSCYDCAAPIAMPSQTTNYYCIAHNSYGCSAVDTVQITVKQCNSTVSLDAGTVYSCEISKTPFIIMNPYKDKDVYLTLHDMKGDTQQFFINPSLFPFRIGADSAATFDLVYAPTTFGHHTLSFSFQFDTGEHITYNCHGQHKSATVRLEANDSLSIQPGQEFVLTVNAIAEDWNKTPSDTMDLTITYPTRMMSRSTKPIMAGNAIPGWNITERVIESGQVERIRLSLQGEAINQNGSIVHVPFTVLLADSLMYHITINATTDRCYIIQPAQSKVGVSSCFVQGRLISTSEIPYSARIDYSTDNLKIICSAGFSGHATITLFNYVGEKITVLLNDTLPKGEYIVEYNGANLPHGLYYISVQSTPFSAILPYVR